jgi:NADPH:quinone reductase-like Zn-dependent oxidoreductase
LRAKGAPARPLIGTRRGSGVARRLPSHALATRAAVIDIGAQRRPRAYLKDGVVTRRSKVLSAIGGLLALLLTSMMVLLTHNGSCEAPPPLAANLSFMRAMVYRCYGAPQVVKLENLEKPRPAPDRVLVKVAAAAVNPLDWHYLKGEPFFMRVSSGVGTPSDIHLGVDFAGTVEAVGTRVTRFKPGDRVFGGADGSFAEYVTPRAEGSMALLPANVSFEQAAALPIAGVTALQALRDKGHVQPGMNVLINGASGGVGTYAVQIAKLLGAKVTGVCSTRNVAMVRSIGADRVVDYTREDFTRLADRYDLIIDNVGSHTQSEYRRVLTPKGTVIMVGGVDCGVCMGPLFTWLGESMVAPFTTQKRLMFLAELNAKDLAQLSGWMAEGKLTSVIDRKYALTDVPAALAYLEQGHARGKVLIDLAAGAPGQVNMALASSAPAASRP